MPDKWLCDICRTASFFTFEEAVAHEEKCRERQQEDEIDGWLCEKCKTATFATFEETAEHEKQCKGMHESRKELDPDNWLCDICKEASFATYEEAVAHENICKEVAEAHEIVYDEVVEIDNNDDDDEETQPPEPAVDPPIPRSINAHHETTPTMKDPKTVAQLEMSPVQALETVAMNDSTEVPQQDISPLKENETVTMIDPKTPPQAETSPTKEQETVTMNEQKTVAQLESTPIKEKEMATQNDPKEVSPPEISPIKEKEQVAPVDQSTNGTADVVQEQILITRWTCDICKKATFDTFEEAVEHESGCSVEPETTTEEPETIIEEPETITEEPETITQEPETITKVDTTTIKPQMKNRVSDVSVGPTKSSEQNKTLCLTPLLGSPNNSQMYYQLSSFHSLLLKCIDLTELPMEVDNRKIRVVSFRCFYCKRLHLVKDREHSNEWTYERFHKSLPDIVFSHLKYKCSDTPRSIVSSLDHAQATQYQGKVGLKAFALDFFPPKGIIERSPTEGCGFSGLIIGNKKYVPESPSQSNSLVSRGIPAKPPIRTKPVDHQNAQLTDGTPLINTKTVQLAKGLSPLYQIGMGQLQFCREPYSGSSGCFQIRVRCKNCASVFNPSSVELWHSVLQNFLHIHMLKTCTKIDKSLREHMVNLSAKKSRGTMTVRDFGRAISKQYKFIDLSPGVGIKSSEPLSVQPLANVSKKKRKFQNAPDDKQESRKRSSRKGSKSRKSGNISQIAYQISGVRRVDDGGLSFYIPPMGGVPLVSSQCEKVVKKLSIYNQLLLDQVELFAVDKVDAEDVGGGADGTKVLGLRCYHCRSDPNKTHYELLRNASSWHEIIIEMGQNHLPGCLCMPQSTRKNLSNAKCYRADKRHTPLIEYCDYLVKLYGIIDLKDEEGNVLGATWGDCKPLHSGYHAQPTDPESWTRQIDSSQSKSTLEMSSRPQHNLMTAKSKPHNINNEMDAEVLKGDRPLIGGEVRGNAGTVNSSDMEGRHSSNGTTVDSNPTSSANIVPRTNRNTVQN